MPAISLKYGDEAVPIDFDENFRVLAETASRRPLSDIEINSRLDEPIGTLTIEEIVRPGQKVLIVVPDGTRQTAAGQIVNLVVRRLIANGSAPNELRIIFATGIHRQVLPDERAEILTPFIADRIKTLDHSPRDLASLVNLGRTSGGIPIELNRALVENDHVILVGGISYHYFAGFTGGRKLICPGLASSRTISATHKLAFNCDSLDRREGVGTALLDGNAVHEAFLEGVEKIAPAFAINTIVDDRGDVTDLFCGDWRLSHKAACREFDQRHSIEIDEKRELVVVSCGGSPHDLNMIQAHKAIEAASFACTEGGTIILLANCGEGLGRSDFLEWFNAADSQELAARLCEKYQVNGQTAWSLLQKAERFKIKIVTELGGQITTKMRLEKIDAASLQTLMKESRRGYVLPRGAKIRVQEISS